MVEMGERELLLGSLKGYLEDLRESGVDELIFTTLPPAAKLERAGTSLPEQEFLVEGDPRGRLLFLMAGTGFSSAAGELLEKIVVAMGFTANSVCLLSVPPGDGRGTGLCRAAISGRIEEVAPEVVVTLGEQGTRLLLENDAPLERLRGRFHDFGGIPLMPSFHPDAMLADQSLKRDVWSDMQQVMRRLAMD